MLFVKNTMNLMGKRFLIFNLKMNEFNQNILLTKNDFEKLYNIITNSSEVNELSEETKKNLLLCSLYNIIDSNEEAQKNYEDNYLNYSGIKNSNNQNPQILHIVFNKIELEVKYRKRNLNELKKLFNELLSFNSANKFVEDYLLMKYYSASLKNLIEEYENSNIFCSDIASSLNENSRNLAKTFSIYLQSRFIYLQIKNFENIEKNPYSTNIKVEIINHLECLFEMVKNIQESLAIKIGLKMSLYQNLTESSNCIKTLEIIMNIIHKQMVDGKIHPNLINQLLYFSCLLAYNNTLISNSNEIIRYTKKLKKNISLLEKFNKNDNSFEEIIPRYKFLLMIYSEFIKDKSIRDEDKNKLIEEYKVFLGDSIKNCNESILNMWILTKNSVPFYYKLFVEKANEYYNGLTLKKQYTKNEYLNFFSFLYNKISFLTKLYSKEPKEEKLKEIQNYVKLIIDYIFEKISIIDELNNIFQLNYIKEIFNRIYFVYIYSFYLLKNYDETLKLIDHYNNLIKFQLELTGSFGTGYFRIQNIKADIFFMTEKYNEAIKEYNKIKSLFSPNPSLLYNLGICHFFIGEKNIGLKRLEESKKLYKKINYVEKINQIDKLIQSIK
jgi:hypothetical protein